ncbi:hypothetical protein [Corynebacterium sp.]|uniref:hypothetical protein n=1 Tax=Corynebacterium sp. TaxID=1720 RepID=UPI00260626C4|nr:hypothetical protein [Corynebacterium sp.]
MPSNFTNRTYQEVPRTWRQLQDRGVTRTMLHRYFEPCTFKTWLAKPPEILRALELAQTAKQRAAILERHASRPALEFPHDTRVRGHFMAHPSWIAGGISALAMQGFPYFHEGQPAHMITPSSRKSTQHPRQARRSTVKVTFEPILRHDALLPDLPLAPLSIAASQFLTSICQQKHTWYSARLPCIKPVHLRIIQGADALCTFTKLTPAELLAQVNNVLPVSREVHRVVLKHGVLGADSPPETWMRLLLKPLLPDLEVQVRISDSDGPVATADLGSWETGLMIFYDGAYHSAAEQREWDTEVNTRLTALGLIPLRLSALSMRSPEQVLERVRTIIRHKRRG